MTLHDAQTGETVALFHTYRRTDMTKLKFQWTFLGQTAASRREVLPAFRQQTPSPSPGCADSLVASKTISFGATKPPAHPEDGDEVSTRNVGKHSHLARKKFTEFCRHESFKSYKLAFTFRNCCTNEPNEMFPRALHFCRQWKESIQRREIVTPSRNFLSLFLT